METLLAAARLGIASAICLIVVIVGTGPALGGLAALQDAFGAGDDAVTAQVVRVSGSRSVVLRDGDALLPVGLLGVEPARCRGPIPREHLALMLPPGAQVRVVRPTPGAKGVVIYMPSSATDAQRSANFRMIYRGEGTLVLPRRPHPIVSDLSRAENTARRQGRGAWSCR